MFFATRWGVEGGRWEFGTSTYYLGYHLDNPAFKVRFPTTNTHVQGENVRAWIGGTADLTPEINVEANLFLDWYDQNGAHDTSFNPPLGVAWEVAEGQYLRAGYAERTPLSERSTLSPLTIAGLRADNPPALVTTRRAE